MNQSLFNQFKNTPTESIMKVGEIKLVEPVSSKRINEQEFDFTFSLNTFTDPEWRDIFQKHYGSKKAKFHGSELTLTCKPTNLDAEMPKVKLIIISTNQDYHSKRGSLIAAINANNEEEHISALNKNVEDDEVADMFRNFKV